jgi:uncharacterized protein (DUF1697 family)
VKRWAALLKGVNVGGNRKLPMAELKAFIEGLGFTDVKTLLASGNVVFSTKETDAATLETKIEKAAAEQIGLTTAFLLRDAADLDAIIAANPFPDAAKEHPNHLLVVFHRDPFPGGLIERIPEHDDGPERLHAIGRELYIDYPNDIGHSTLHKAMGKLKFPKLATARNWNTVGKLRALL